MAWDSEVFGGKPEASGWDTTIFPDKSATQETPPEPPLKLGLERLPEDVKDVAKNFSGLSQAAVGAKAIWDLAALKLKQGPGFTLSPEDQTTIKVNRALLESSNPALAGAAITGIGATALGAPAANFAAARIAPVLPGFLQPTVPAAVMGMMVNHMTNPTLPGEDQNKAVDAGAVGGALADALVRGGSRLVQPIIQSEPVQRLLQKGIVPTLGQAAGGVVARTEEKLASWPFVGDIIKNAMNRGRNELGTAAINLQMPTGMKVNQPGSAGVDQADDLLSGAYQKLYGNTQVSRDAQLVSDLKNAVNTPTIPLSDEYKRMYDQIIKKNVLGRMKPGESLAAGDVKAEIESDLGKAIRGLNPKGQEGSLREALFSARQAVRDLAGRQAGVSQAERQVLDRAYANVRDVGVASDRAAASGGIPTPLQLVNAAKSGSALEQLGRDAQEVMGSRIPNSGTTDRALMALLLGGAGAGASQTQAYQDTPYLNAFGPGFWLALGASPLAYSRLGTQYMLGDNAIQPALAQALRSTSPYAASAGALYSRNK